MGAEFIPMMPPRKRQAHQDKLRPQPALGPEDGADRFEEERPDRAARDVGHWNKGFAGRKCSGVKTRPALGVETGDRAGKRKHHPLATRERAQAPPLEKFLGKEGAWGRESLFPKKGFPPPHSCLFLPLKGIH